MTGDSQVTGGEAATPRAEGALPGGDPSQTPGADGSQHPFERFQSEQSEEIRSQAENYVRGLKSALERVKAERNESRAEIDKIRKDRTLDGEEKVKAIQTALAGRDRKLAVYESLAAHVNNLELAWAAVSTAPELLHEDGAVDVEAFRSRFPQLFGSPKGMTPPAFAGAGTEKPPARAASMNDWIREQLRAR